HTRSQRDWSSDVCSSDLQGRDVLVHSRNSTPLVKKSDVVTTKILNPEASMPGSSNHKAAMITLSFGSVERKTITESPLNVLSNEIGRASCRERERRYVEQ